MSHAGSALLAQVADKSGLTQALSVRLAGVKQRQSGHALAQIPVQHIENVEILVRTDSTGAPHDLTDFCREHRLRYFVGYELTDAVRAAPGRPGPS